MAWDIKLMPCLQRIYEMAKRFYDTGLVDQEWYMNLNPTQKALYIHLLCKCDVAGVFEINYRMMSVYIGSEINEQILFESFGKRIVPLFDHECTKGIISDFVWFQCGGTLNENVKAHTAVIRRLNDLGITIDELKKICTKNLIYVPRSMQNKTVHTNNPSEEVKKDTVNVESLFEEFWMHYPRHDSKKVSIAKFSSIMKGMNHQKAIATLNAMIKAIECSKNSEQWIKDKGKYIPMPSTWLNQRRWEDEGVQVFESNNLFKEEKNTISRAISEGRLVI